jgi:hypothetical protein
VGIFDSAFFTNKFGLMKKQRTLKVSIIIPTKVWAAKMSENGGFLGFILRGPFYYKCRLNKVVIASAAKQSAKVSAVFFRCDAVRMYRKWTQSKIYTLP